MRGMILAAGEGTRLRPLTYARPKALVPILTVPVMENIVRWLCRCGIKELAVNLWYHGEAIESYFRDGSPFHVSITYLREDELHGTAGAVRLMADFLCSPGETVLIIGCDELIDLDLQAMLQFHRERKALVTISLARVNDPRPFGVVERDEEGRIVRFLEKPKEWGGKTAWVNSGVYLLEPEVIYRIPYGSVYDFGKQLFPEMVARGEPIYAFPSDGYWNDIGHIRNYWGANLMALRKGVPLHDCPLKETRPFVFIHPEASVSEGAVLLAPCAIGSGTVVEEGAQIGPETVIGEGCHIETGAKVERSILWSEVTVASNTRLKGCLITDRCIVQSGTPLQEAILVGRKT